jgi:catalase
MSPIEREHIIAAYSFELSKWYEQTIKEGALKGLADIDPQLCEQVGHRPRSPGPSRHSSPRGADPSPVLSQVGKTWPLDSGDGTGWASAATFVLAMPDTEAASSVFANVRPLLGTGRWCSGGVGRCGG